MLNDIKLKVKGRFSKEISIADDDESITYVFPDTQHFISILRRKIGRELMQKED